ncbi:gliding motility-associated C-terminal domain-containing protein, partial [Pustulibacterium marinum]
VTVEQSLSSGDFVGLTTYCTSEGTIDLFDLLVNEDTGGIWTDASNNTVSNEIDITSLTAGTYNYTYTVSSASCGDNATEISFVIDTSVANAGNFTGLIEVCNLDATFDLYTLLDGTQDEGGVWTNSNNEIVSSIITPADYNTGTNTFTYTVSGSCVSDSETVQIEILESIDMDAVTLSVDTEICYGTQALVALQNIPDGVYTITYSLSGSNTVGDQNANIAVNAGTGSFVVDESLLSNVGVTTISVTEILPQETNSCNTSSATITASFEVVEGPSIATSALSIDNVCLGNEGILTITNTNLSDGDYQLTYSLETTSGSNSYTSETISFANGDAVFNIPVDQISLTDAYLLTITSVVNLDTGCANLNTDAFITFEVTDVPDIDVDQTKLFTQNVCLGVANDVIISNPSIPDGDYIIEYEVSGVVNYSESDLIVTLIDGEAVFTIPGEVLATEGTVSVLLVNLSDGAVECPIYFTDIASATFEIYNGDMIEMEEEGNIFCEQDMPTFESLTENLINPDGEVAWYDAAVGGNMYENTDMLEPGVTYYGVYADYADCPNTERLAVTVDITYCDVIIPDGFSPNNDGVNETFTIHNLREYYPNFEIEIFNRYGNVVYKGNFDTPDWDGKTNTGAVTIGSNGVPTGVYFFVLQLHIEGRDAIQGRLYLNR